MKRILCYGDSNTWGYISGSRHLRYNENERWTKLLQKELGTEFEVIEEGLNSRTLFSEDTRPGKIGKNGFTYLYPCVCTHDPIDFFILMLGTNELKNMYKNTPQDILRMYKKYIKILLNYKSQIDGKNFKLIIQGIPPVTELEGKDSLYYGAAEKAKQVSELISDHCKNNKITYIDNFDLKTGIDGIHLTKESHIMLAERTYKTIKNLL